MPNRAYIHTCIIETCTPSVAGGISRGYPNWGIPTHTYYISRCCVGWQGARSENLWLEDSIQVWIDVLLYFLYSVSIYLPPYHIYHTHHSWIASKLFPLNSNLSWGRKLRPIPTSAQPKIHIEKKGTRITQFYSRRMLYSVSLFRHMRTNVNRAFYKQQLEN